MPNKIFIVEDFVYKVLYEKYQPSEDEIKNIGEILGQPTKKLDVVLDRYKQVFSRYIDKKCYSEGVNTICIYTWNQRIPFKSFPLSMHATGTIILFEYKKPKEVLAYPIPKALSYAKSSGVTESRYGGVVPKEVTKRIDGWQLTAYYNPIIGRWIFATKYVLHNMYFERSRLVVENLEKISNPFVYVSDRLAEESGLYDMLKGYKGWTFTFILLGPEPAITKPPYPLGDDYRKYELYLIMARDPSGRLYTWSETAKLLNFKGVEFVEPRPLAELYKDAVNMLDIRSYIAYIDTSDAENPLLIEVESEVYQDAMNVKYMYDAKSAALIISIGLTEALIKIIDQKVSQNIRAAAALIDELRSVLESVNRERASEASWEIIRTLSEFRENVDIHVEEIAKAFSEGNTVRVLRKTLSILLEGRSIIAGDTIDQLKGFVMKLKYRLK